MWPPLAYSRVRLERVEARVKHGDEGGGAGDLPEDAVEVFDDCGWSAEIVGAKTESHGERGHEEGSGDALPETSAMTMSTMSSDMWKKS